jgi:P-type E1-E2 ATPase
MSRAARRGVIIKTGGALEVLARAKTFAFDKTGTITLGVPKVVRVDSFGAEPVDVVAVAASLDQCSAHVLAQALVTHARSLGKELIYPELCKESFGQGIEGTIAASLYRFGSLSFLEANGVDITAVICTHHEQALESGVMSVYLSKGTAVVGSVLFADEIRSDAKDLFTTLRAIPGVRLFMLSGDKEAVAKKIAAQIGLEEVHAQCLPEDKVRIITEVPAPQRPAVMIGDGINDAPALAVADVGIALGSAGKTASSDAASIVIVSGSITRVGEVVMVARRALGVATQGILIGIGLSTVGMLFGAFGFVPPLAGALLQEAIDVIVILNALRVARS